MTAINPSTPVAESIGNGVCYALNAPGRLIDRIFGPLGHKTVRLIVNTLGDTGPTLVKVHPFVRSLIGVVVTLATGFFVKQGYTFINNLRLDGMADWNQGKTITALAKWAGGLAITAVLVSVVWFTATGLLSGVMFGVA